MKYLKGYKLFEDSLGNEEFKISDNAGSFYSKAFIGDNFTNNKLSDLEYDKIYSVIDTSKYKVSYEKLNWDYFDRNISHLNSYIVEINYYNGRFDEQSINILKDKDDYYYVFKYNIGFGPLYKFDQLDELVIYINDIVKDQLSIEDDYE